jgi:hypothetical protein
VGRKGKKLEIDVLQRVGRYLGEVKIIGVGVIIKYVMRKGLFLWVIDMKNS